MARGRNLPGVLRMTAVALAMGAGSASETAAAKYPPQLDRRVIEEIQSRRYRPANAPADAQALAWPEWRETRKRCNSGPWGAYLRAHAAVFKDGVCSQLTDDVWKILKMMGPRYIPFVSPGIQGQVWNDLEGSSAVGDLPDASYQCAARLLVYSYTDDPTQRAAWDKRILALANLKGLNDFAENLAKAKAAGLEGLGDTDLERLGEAWDTAKAPGETKGWLDSVVDGFESLDFTKRVGMMRRRVAAAAALGRCDFAGALAGRQALRQEGLEYLWQARAHLVWTEELVYCFAPPLADGAPPPAASDLVAASAEIGRLEPAEAHYREALKWYVSIFNDPVLGEQGVAAKREKIKQLMDAALDLERDVDRRAACGGNLGEEARRLAMRIRDECSGEGAQRFAAGDPARLLRRIDQLESGRAAFARALGAARTAAEKALGECRFGTALQALGAGLAAFDRAQAAANVSSATYRACYDPWPLDDLERQIRQRGDAIAAAQRAAEAALGAARGQLAGCDFVACRQSLGEAAGHLAGTGCPQSGGAARCTSDPELCAIARLFGQVEAVQEGLIAKEKIVQADLGQRANQRQEAVASIEARVTQAEGSAPGRCAAIVRARGELARLPALAQGPAECPALGDPDLAGLAAAFEARLAKAERLGVEDLQRLRQAAEAAAASCDATALAQHEKALQGLPEICAADAAAARQAVADLRRRLADDLHHLAQRLHAVDAAWGAAWNACDVNQLAEMRQSVGILNQHSCAARALGAQARTRLDNLLQLSEKVPAMVRRKATLDARVFAKLELAEGFVRLVESASRAVNTAAAAAGLHGKLDQAEQVLREIDGMADADLPAMCFDSWREQIADLRARLAAARGQIRAGADAGNTDGTLVEPERPGRGAVRPPPDGNRDEEPPTAGGSGWDDALGGARRTAQSGATPTTAGAGEAPPMQAGDVEALLAAATAAYAACDFAGAQTLLISARAMAPLDPRIARLSGLIAGQLQAAGLYNAALQSATADQALGLLAQADAAAGAAATSPPCLKARIADARTRGAAARTRDRAVADEQRSRDAWRGLAQGLLGTLIPIYNAGVAAGGGGPAIGGAVPGLGPGSTAAGQQAYCHIQLMPRGEADRPPVTLLLSRQPTANLVQYAVHEVPADTAELQAAQWARASFSVVARYTSYDAAQSEARRRCPNPVTPPAF